jgi:adenosylcobinamide kinase/adenosylcobinamide-phosphate guanylyltransferase
VLVLGGARSGKSTFAERLAGAATGPIMYVATAEARDDEMAARIAHHRARRPREWQTLEAPTHLATTVQDALARGGDQARVTVLVEDLTLLAANLMETLSDRAEEAAIAEVDALLTLEADVILVSNEVGMGIVPAYPAGRAFRDLQGRLNQHAAARCNEVYFLVAGLPLSVK